MKPQKKKRERKNRGGGWKERSVSNSKWRSDRELSIRCWVLGSLSLHSDLLSLGFPSIVLRLFVGGFFFNFFLVTEDGRGYCLSCYISPPFCFPTVIVQCRCCCRGSFLYQPLFLGSLNWQTLIVFICCDEICNGRFFNFQSNSDQKCNKGIKMKV